MKARRARGSPRSIQLANSLRDTRVAHQRAMPRAAASTRGAYDVGSPRAASARATSPSVAQPSPSPSSSCQSFRELARAWSKKSATESRRPLSGSPPGAERETSRGREGREGSEEGRRGGHREKEEEEEEEEVDSFGFSPSAAAAVVVVVVVVFGGRSLAASGAVIGPGGGRDGIVFSSAEAFLRRSSGTGGSAGDELAVEVDDDDAADADANDDDDNDKAPTPLLLLLLLLCSSPFVLPASPPPKGHERLANGGCGPPVIILNVGRERRASTAASRGCEGDDGNGDGDTESNASLIDGEHSSPWKASARRFGRARRGMIAMQSFFLTPSELKTRPQSGDSEANIEFEK